MSSGLLCHEPKTLGDPLEVLPSKSAHPHSHISVLLLSSLQVRTLRLRQINFIQSPFQRCRARNRTQVGWQNHPLIAAFHRCSVRVSQERKERDSVCRSLACTCFWGTVVKTAPPPFSIVSPIECKELHDDWVRDWMGKVCIVCSSVYFVRFSFSL